MKTIQTTFARIILSLTFILCACSTSEIIIPEATVIPQAEAVFTAEPTTDEPLEITPIDDLLPAGVLTSIDEGDSVSLYDLEGNLIDSVLTPGLVSPDPESIHIAGGLHEDKQFPPLIYRNWNTDQALIYLERGTAEKIRGTGSFLAMAGAKGEPSIAFSEIDWEGETPRSYLFAGNHETISSAAPLAEFTDEKTGMVLKPVGVTVLNKNINEILYTKTAWGIGGIDFIFSIQRGLFLYDLGSGKIRTILSDSRNFQGISPDFSFSASTDFGIGETGPLLVSLTEQNRSVQFPLHPESDRGAGFVVFSPNNQNAAWMEAQGSITSYEENFSARVRVGEILTGSIIQEVDNTTAAAYLGWEEVQQLKPVAWLDNETVIVQARGADWSNPTLILLDSDTGKLSYFCAGVFLELVY